MPDRKKPAGIPLPNLWQTAVALAVACGGWLFWTEIRDCVLPPHDQAIRGSLFERIREVEALVERGRAAVPDLLALTASTDPKSRCDGLFGLGRLGPEAAASLEVVRERLSDDDPRVRASALSAYSRICSDGEEVAAAAVRQLSDSDGGVRDGASGILGYGGAPAIRALIGRSKGGPPIVRLSVVRLLQRLDTHRDDPQVTAALRALLDDGDREIRIEAIKAVIDRNAASLAEVREWLSAKDPDLVDAGLWAVSWLGPEAAGALPELQHLIESSDEKRMLVVAQRLWSLETSARPAVPALLKRIEGLKPREKLQAAETLYQIGANAAEIVELVTPLLADNDPFVSRAARQQLARADPQEARRMALNVIRQIEAGSKSIDRDVLGKLWGIESYAPEAVPFLLPLLNSPDEELQSAAIGALGRIGPEAAPAVPALVALLGLRTLHTTGIIDALGRIGKAANPAVPSLLNIVNGSASMGATPPGWAGDRQNALLAAIRALGHIGNASPKVLTALRRQLTKDDIAIMQGQPLQSAVRLTALQSLILLLGESRELLPDLLRALENDSWEVRAQAALAIGDVPGDRRQAVEPLTAALTDESAYVRSAVALALRDVGPDAKGAVGPLHELLRDGRNEVLNRVRDRPGPYPQTVRRRWPCDLARLSVTRAARSALAAIESQHPTDSGDTDPARKHQTVP
jgi:HEAT repeat protein